MFTVTPPNSSLYCTMSEVCSIMQFSLLETIRTQYIIKKNFSLATNMNCRLIIIIMIFQVLHFYPFKRVIMQHTNQRKRLYVLGIEPWTTEQKPAMEYASCIPFMCFGQWRSQLVLGVALSPRDVLRGAGGGCCVVSVAASSVTLRRRTSTSGRPWVALCGLAVPARLSPSLWPPSHPQWKITPGKKYVAPCIEFPHPEREGTATNRRSYGERKELKGT